MADLVIAHHTESLHWLDQIDKSKYRPIIISKTKQDADIYQSKNIGCEASAYFEYIIKYYNDLPDFVVFVHGHETAWHQHGRIQDILNSFTFDENTPRYYNFNKEPLNFLTLNDDERPNDFKSYNAMVAPLGFEIGVIYYIVSSRCAQFIVHRSLIHRHTLDTYKMLLENLYTKNNGNQKLAAIVFEWLWTYIFTGETDEIEWISKNKNIETYSAYVAGHHATFNPKDYEDFLRSIGR